MNGGVRVPRWYTAGWLLGLPLAALYLGWRGLRQPEYRRHWAERFLGDAAARAASATGDGELVWVHAVSLGETRAARPLIEQLAAQRPDARFLLTHMTPTGRAAGEELARALPGRVAQRYLPYDVPCAVRRFLRQTRPQLGVLIETELWPNLLQGARAQGLPMVLANARLSARSLAKGRRFPRLMRAAAAGVRAVGAQSPLDAQRLASFYEGPIVVTGNLKFDLAPDAQQQAQGRAWRERLRADGGQAGAARPIWLFASTREGEERLLLQAWRAFASPGLRPVLLLVPRHPQRFDEVAELAAAEGLSVLRRSAWEAAGAARRAAAGLLLGDSMGEMPLYYAMADVAMVGGSLLPLGGQNLIEACACGCPVVMGPHMFNFAQAAADALAAGAAWSVPDAAQALRAMHEIASDAVLRARMSAAAIAFAQQHRGATARTIELIESVWPGRPAGAASAAAAR